MGSIMPSPESSNPWIGIETKDLGIPAAHTSFDQQLEMIIILININFETQKNIFQNFITEKDLVKSKEFLDFIDLIKNKTSEKLMKCDNIKWLEEYIKSYLVSLWRKHQPKIYASAQHILKPTLIRENGPFSIQKNRWLIEDIYSHHNNIWSEQHPASTLSIDQMNFIIICQYDDGTRIVPDLELPATYFFHNTSDAYLSQNNSWEFFKLNFERLLYQKSPEKGIRIQGAFKYIHPDKTIRTINNQQEFSLSLDHIFRAMKEATFYFFAATEAGSMKICDEKEVVSASIGPIYEGFTTGHENLRATQISESNPSSNSKIPVSKKDIMKNYTTGGISKLARMRMKEKPSRIPRSTLSINRRLNKSSSDQSWFAPDKNLKGKRKFHSVYLGKYQRIKRKRT